MLVSVPYSAPTACCIPTPQVLAHTPALDCAGLIVPGASVRMTANAPRKDGAQPTKTTHAIQVRPWAAHNKVPSCVITDCARGQPHKRRPREIAACG